MNTIGNSAERMRLACWRCPPRHRELFLTLYARLSARILKLDRSQLLAVYPLDFGFYVANPLSSIGGSCWIRPSLTATKRRRRVPANKLVRISKKRTRLCHLPRSGRFAAGSEPPASRIGLRPATARNRKVRNTFQRFLIHNSSFSLGCRLSSMVILLGA